ncbi:hypothetical protein ANN_01051 [Periplaneta americana]|uniref:Uncharacterized protein n=1 Tax=Periplaneta americana TaxID=6978 RepID=A0ABQ8TUA0_PERAM|nr:hypothetical protein ANN_01051 [Periplaneta americana]
MFAFSSDERAFNIESYFRTVVFCGLKPVQRSARVLLVSIFLNAVRNYKPVKCYRVIHRRAGRRLPVDPELLSGVAEIVRNFVTAQCELQYILDNILELHHQVTKAFCDGIINLRQSETLKNIQHRNIRSLIATVLREKHYIMYKEIHGISLEGSYRRIDTLAIPPNSSVGYIIDPTIRTESCEDQPLDVH